jgi:hypothetical protein
MQQHPREVHDSDMHNMKNFKEFLSEAVSIKNDKDLVKALYDIEANAKGKAKMLAAEVAEYVEDNELDQKAAKKFNDLAGMLGSGFSQARLVNAVEDYIEKNM